jgi:DNA-binding MarR family transcriptional regulator
MRIEEALKTNRFRSEPHKAILNLLYSAYWFNDNFNQMLKPFDITQEQFNVLRILRGSLPNSLCVRDIASRMIEKSSNVPRILDRLARKEYIIRQQSDGDKRETNIVITQKALNLLKKTDAVVTEGENNLINLTDEEALLLNELLEKIRDTKNK